MPWLNASFDVGIQEKHTVGVALAFFSGLEIYTVDGVEVLRRRSFALRGSRTLSVGHQEKHEVTIFVHLLPSWRSFFSMAEFRAEVFVDGTLWISDLFPKQREQLQGIDRIVSSILLLTLAPLVGIIVLLITWTLLIPWFGRLWRWAFG